MKNRLLIVHPTVAPYRIRFFNDLYDAFQTHIFLYYRNLKDQKFDYEKIESRFHYTPQYADRTFRIGQRDFYLGTSRAVRAHNPDIVMVSEYGEALWSAILTRALTRKNYAILVMCDDSLDYAAQCRGIRKLSRDLALKYVDGLILCNDRADAWYRQHFPVETFVFPIVQDETEFREDEAEALRLADGIAEKYDLEGKRVFLYVGRLAPEKNLEYLIRSFIVQHEEHPENVLFLVGGQSDRDPGFRERMEALLEERGAAGYIRFAGRKEGTELKAWYAAGQIFVLPSVSEPFGAVVNEALLAGEYVLVSDRAGSACLVTPENGQAIDVDRPSIDFGEISRRVPPLRGGVRRRESRMPFQYGGKMEAFIAWIRKVVAKRGGA